MLMVTSAMHDDIFVSAASDVPINADLIINAASKTTANNLRAARTPCGHLRPDSHRTTERRLAWL